MWFQVLFQRRAEDSCPDGVQVQACWTGPMGQDGCSALCPRQRSEPWMEAREWSYLTKCVREAHSKAETNWFYRVPDIILDAVRVKEAVEESLFSPCRRVSRQLCTRKCQRE